MELNWTAIGSLATAICALTSAAGVIWAVRSHRQTLNHQVLVARVQLFQDVVADWEEALPEYRRSCSAKLLGFWKSSILFPENEDGVDVVLDFFHRIGTLTRRGVLDRDLVHDYFGYYVVPYWICARKYVQTRRKDIPSLWSEFDWLYHDLEGYASSSGRSSDVKRLIEIRYDILKREEGISG